MIGMSRGSRFKLSGEPVGVVFGHVEDGEGEDGRVIVRMDFENFFFYRFVMFFDSFAKEDNFIRFFDPVIYRRPEIERAHAGNDINTPRESLLEEVPSDVLGLLPGFTGDVDKNHAFHKAIISGLRGRKPGIRWEYHETF